MGYFDLPEKKRKLILFSVTLAVLLGLVFFLGSSLTGNSPAEEKSTVVGNTIPALEMELVFDADEKLQEKLAELQQLDRQYADAMTDDKKSDSFSKMILRRENDLRTAIDALSGQGATIANEVMQKKFKVMINRYQQTLESRLAIGSLRNAVAMQQHDFTTDEKSLLKMQDELMQKNNRIAALEGAAKTLAKQPVISLKNDNSEMLGRKITELETAVNSFTNANSVLKQENERLQKSQSDNSRNTNGNEMMLKEKATSLQQKVDVLNAELQLAHVDCNLSRVDATQIISNAKQRKQLLAEASNILTGLSAIASDEVKKKVKDKIVKLNQVAANARE